MFLLKLLILVSSSWGVEMADPSVLCERFVGEDDIKSCLSRIKSQKPDWYLASVCQYQFEHDNFWHCLDLSKTHQFDPIDIQACASAELKDNERMSCLKSKAKSLQANTRQPLRLREPSSLKKPKTNKAVDKKTSGKAPPAKSAPAPSAHEDAHSAETENIDMPTADDFGKVEIPE